MSIPLPSCVAAMSGVTIHQAVFDPSCCAPGLSLLQDNHCVAQIDSAGDAAKCVHAVRDQRDAAAPLTNKIHYWSFAVERPRDSPVYVGLTSGGAPYVLKSSGYPGCKGCNGMSLCLNDGTLRTKGATEYTIDANVVKVAKHIGILVHDELATCSFFADGRQLGTVARCINSHFLYPAVALRDKNSAVRSDVPTATPPPARAANVAPIRMPDCLRCMPTLKVHNVVFEPAHCMPGLEVSENNRIVTCTSIIGANQDPTANLCFVAEGSNSKDGLHYWSMTLLRRGVNTMVGLCRGGNTMEERCSSFSSGGYDVDNFADYCVFLSLNDGTVKGKTATGVMPNAARIKAAQRVGILLNANHGSATLFCDGELMGVFAMLPGGAGMDYHPVIVLRDVNTGACGDEILDDRPTQPAATVAPPVAVVEGVVVNPNPQSGCGCGTGSGCGSQAAALDR